MAGAYAGLALGQDAALIARLRLLVAAHPLRERLWGQLMTALYPTGQQAAALAAYRQVRTQLVADLGVEPGPGLRELHQQILAGDTPATPTCSTSQLLVWLGISADRASGWTANQVELTNVSQRTCTLFGFPGVSAVDLNGHQLGSPAVRDHSDHTRLVVLGPGATAHAFLLIFDVTRYPTSACRPTAAFGPKVYPPNNRTATVVPFSFEACRVKSLTFLRVRTTVAHTGIPGFSP